MCPSGEESLGSQKGVAMITWNAAGTGFVASATSVLVALLIPHELCEAEVASWTLVNANSGVN